MGSKSKISKHIVPIIQKCIDENNVYSYIDPFVGGANVIDKIKCKNRIGSDINIYLISLLKQAQTDVSIFPSSITKKQYFEAKEDLQ